MPIKKDKLFNTLKASFPGSHINITALVDDDDHYSVEITSEAFNGKTKVEQHRLVQNALGDLLSGELHALSIKTIQTERT